MALSLRKKGSGGPVNIPTASQGDIAFLILIFFMSTSMFGKEKGLKIVLPEPGAEGTKIKPENILNVGVNPDGQVLAYVGNESPVTVTIPDLRDLVVRRLAENPDLAISFRVSRRAPYKVMVDVFDQFKLAKAERVSLIHVAELDEGAGP